MFQVIKNLFHGSRYDSRDAHNENTNGDGPAPYYVDAGGGARVEVIAHARAAGRENLPESSARQPNDVEAAIEQENTRRHQALIEKTRVELKTVSAEGDRLERAMPSVRDLRAVPQRSEAGIRHELASDDAMVPRWQEAQQSRRDLRHFAISRGLARPAQYPKSRIRHFAWLGPLIVMESAANCVFFAGASAFGLAGGFLVAVLVSGINVAAGALTGYFPLRWRNHPSPMLKRLSAVALVAYGVFVLLFNWIVASCRDAAAAGVHLSFDQLFRHPAVLSLESCALLFIGIIASLLAVRKGFTACDPHPGYSDHDRQFQEAEQAFAAARDDLRDRVMTWANRVPTECATVLERAEDIVAQMGDLVVRAERLVEAYEKHRAGLHHWCRQWLTRYRTENASVRTTPAPRYFASYPDFPSQIDRSVVVAVTEQGRLAGAALEALKREASSIIHDQPQRVAAAREQFERFMRERVRQADRGRGDGSTHQGGEERLAEERAS